MTDTSPTPAAPHPARPPQVVGGSPQGMASAQWLDRIRRIGHVSDGLANAPKGRRTRRFGRLGDGLEHRVRSAMRQGIR